jgi:dihydroorotate dehydrogenase (fumarate)
MNLATKYLGFDLPHPFIPGASPLAVDLDSARRLEDAGAAAIILHSLFEEQINRESVRITDSNEPSAAVYREGSSYFPKTHELPYGPHGYLEHLHRLKQAVHVPVIASLNGLTPSGWLKYAELIEDAGADGLELNIYYLPDMNETGFEIEQHLIESVRIIKANASIPIAVKLSPFYSSTGNLIARLDDLMVQGIVIFNRFYQPDVGPDEVDMMPMTHLSNSSELLLRLRWLSILSGRIRASLAITGGVHTGEDAGRAIAAGANAVQVVSALLQHGPEYLGTLRIQLEEWMEKHGFNSINQLCGCMSLQNCPNPAAYERANYARVLHARNVPQVSEGI